MRPRGKAIPLPALGDRLKAAKARLGLTWLQLGMRLKVSQRTLMRWVTGRTSSGGSQAKIGVENMRKIEELEAE